MKKYQTIPFVFELVVDADSIQYVILRKVDGQVIDVADTLGNAADSLFDIIEENYFADVIKKNES